LQHGISGDSPRRRPAKQSEATYRFHSEHRLLRNLAATDQGAYAQKRGAAERIRLIEREESGGEGLAAETLDDDRRELSKVRLLLYEVPRGAGGACRGSGIGRLGTGSIGSSVGEDAWGGGRSHGQASCQRLEFGTLELLSGELSSQRLPGRTWPEP